MTELTRGDLKLVRAALHTVKRTWSDQGGPFPKQAIEAAELEEKIEEILDKQDATEARRDKLAGYFDPKGNNFMGSGLSLVEFMALGKLEAYERALPQQPLEERRRRWDLIHRMVDEQSRLRLEHGNPSYSDESRRILYGESINCHTAIEAVYEGDVQKLRDVSTWLTFPDAISNPGDKEKWEPIYADFRKLVIAAYEGAPTDEPRGETH